MKQYLGALRVLDEPVESATTHVVGLALMWLTPGLVVSALIEWGSGGPDEVALLLTAAIAAGVGWVLHANTTLGDDVRAVSVFSIVAWSWVASSAVGALPFLFGDMFTIGQWDLAIFESVSGFSCTGSTVLADIEAHGRGVLMWRQLTQWYGGMGMVLLAVSVLPYLGVGGLALMTAEAPGHSSDRLAPRVSETAQRLWLVYTGVTALVALALWAVPGPSLYDSVAHAVATAATGGFSPYNSSVGHFESFTVELILVGAMILCGMNFALHYQLLTGDRGAWWRSTEIRLYWLIIAGGTAFVTLTNWTQDVAGLGTSFRDSLFNVVTLATSTGFGNVRPDGIGDFVRWGGSTQVLLLFLMVVGGCTGSTAGGAKVFRLLIGSKAFTRELKRLRHPRGVFPIKLGTQAIPDSIVASAMGFLAMFLMLTIAGTLAVAATGADILTAASAAVSAMSNMGPGLSEAGPTSNFLIFDRPARLILAALMLIGRLEIYAVLLMFASTARRYRSGSRRVRALVGR